MQNIAQNMGSNHDFDDFQSFLNFCLTSHPLNLTHLSADLNTQKNQVHEPREQPEPAPTSNLQNDRNPREHQGVPGNSREPLGTPRKNLIFSKLFKIGFSKGFGMIRRPESASAYKTYSRLRNLDSKFSEFTRRCAYFFCFQRFSKNDKKLIQ